MQAIICKYFGPTNSKGLVGSIIQHRHSDRQAVLLSIEEGVNGGLRVQWLTDKREISLPASDFDTISEEANNVPSTI